MPGIEHYRTARDRALEELKQDLNPWRFENLGAETSEEGRVIRLPVMEWKLELHLDPYRMSVLPIGGEAAVEWQVLALDYLSSMIPPPTKKFISFTDFSELRNYEKPFTGRVIRRLEGGVAREEESFREAAGLCGGEEQSSSPLMYDFPFFPLLSIRIVRHPGDEDLPASCNVLFPDNALRLLTAESVIVAAESLTRCLEGRSPAAED